MPLVAAPQRRTKGDVAVNALANVLGKLSKLRKVELACYLVLSVLSFVAALAFEQVSLLLNVLLVLFCMVALVKLVRRIRNYGNILQKRRLKTRKEARLQYFSSVSSQKNHVLYVRVILCFWLVFLLGCFTANRVLEVPPFVFLAGIFFLYALDIVFYSAFCLLNYMANRLFRTEISCCYLCPVRGWDLLMLNLPLLFIWPHALPAVKPLLVFVLVLSVLGFFLWEYGKFFVLPATDALPLKTPRASQQNTPCAHCKRSCGEEYNGRRSCMRLYTRKKKSL